MTTENTRTFTYDLSWDSDEDDEDFEEQNIFDDPDWEDSSFPVSISEKYPGWHQLKITYFTGGKLSDIKTWCDENVKHGKWESVGWKSGCSYSVGIVMESARDAMMYRLRWN